MGDGLVFDQLSDRVLEVRDTISNQQYRFESADAMDVEPTEYDDFPGPVTDSVVIDADELRLPVFYSATARDEDGNMVMHLGLDCDGFSPSEETTFIEFQTPVKSYLRIDGDFEYTNTLDEVTIDLSDSTRLIFGSRTWQCYPNETITVSESVDDLREAISHFGDIILTSSPERSFSTLRGHPPKLRVGNSLHIPDSLSKPSSGVTITLPPTTSALLTVAPLAYYLLATVEFGDCFTIETETGFSYRPEEEQVADAVASILTRCFYLDCIVRTEGLYPLDLQERHDFQTRAEATLDFETLYDQPLPERLESYLQIDPSVISAITPEWPMTAVVEPGVQGIEALPYLVYELADIRPQEPPRYTGDEARKHVLDAFSKGVQKNRSTGLVFENEAEFVDIPQTKSQQTIWVGDGIPLGATKFLLSGYENYTFPPSKDDVNSGETSSSELEVTVVCNEGGMAQESTDIQDTLDPRDDFPMEINVYEQVSRRQLRQILETGTDYLHFIGHATPAGLECSDGMLDVSTIEQSNVPTFFLNACQSYQQGTELVKQGSSGGIVTYSDVSDRYALKTSRLIGLLLNNGFVIGNCLSLVRDTTPIGGQYTVVGTHKAKLIQPEATTPHLIRISKCESGYELQLTAYGSGASGYTMGGLIKYTIEPLTRYQVIPSSVEVTVQLDELLEFLSPTDLPVIYERELQTQEEFLDAVRD